MFSPTLPEPNTSAPCPHFAQCGGCDLQDRTYSVQVAYKEAWLTQLLAPVLARGGTVLPLIPTPGEQPLMYRNKIRYGFVVVGNTVQMSRHSKQEEDADIPVTTCLLQSKRSVELAHLTAHYATKYRWGIHGAYNTAGVLKHLLIREGKHTGECMVGLVSTEAAVHHLDAWVHAVQQVEGVSSIYHIATQGKNNETLIDTLLWGSPTITERVGEWEFVISPHAFFQTNSTTLQTLYDAILNACNLQGDEVVWDLYAGSATIGLYVSSKAQTVISIESNLQNIADAQQNIVRNRVENVEIISGTVESVVTSQFIRERGLPDVVIVDPPRAGLSPRFRALLPNLQARAIIYVSCNPLTFARDARELINSGYQLEWVRGIDMFPQTLHCELVARFHRR